MDNRIIKTISLAAIIFLGFSLAACGKKTSEETESENNDGYEYVATFESIESPIEDGNIYTSRIENGYIYSLIEVPNEDENQSFSLDYKVEKVNISTKESEIIDIDLNREAQQGVSLFVNAFFVFEDGFGFLKNNYNFETEKTSYCVIFTDRNGKYVSTVSFDNIVADGYISNSEVDKSGNLYIATDNGIYKMNKTGDVLGTVKNNDYLNGLEISEDGTVYVVKYSRDSGKTEIDVVDFSKGKLVKEKDSTVTNASGLSFLNNGNLLIHGSESVYEYNLKTKEENKLWKWMDVDLDSVFDIHIEQTEDGSYQFAYQSFNNNAPSKLELVTIQKRAITPDNQKNVIKLACLGLDYSVKEKIVDFNKHNSDYRIQVEDYYEKYSDWQTGYSQLQIDVTQDAFDIVCSDSSQGLFWVEKGLFTDVYPYMKNDSDIPFEDLNETVFKAYEKDGKLYFVIPTISINTVIGSKKTLGDMTSWTIDDLARFRKENPDKMFFNYGTQLQVAEVLIAFSMSDFVDFEKGDCNFETDEFKKILEIAKTFPKEIDYENYQEWESVMSGDIMFMSTSISGYDEMSIYPQLFDGEVTFIGYPSCNGKGNTFFANKIYGICEKSQYKEAAWDFLKTLYSDDFQEEIYNGFPVNKKVFENRLKEAVKESVYKDENGTERRNSNSSWTYENITLYLYKPTEEEAKVIRDLYESVDSIIDYDDEFMNLILEEADAYFSEQKSFEEVSKIIQSRANIYIAEKR